MVNAHKGQSLKEGVIFHPVLANLRIALGSDSCFVDTQSDFPSYLVIARSQRDEFLFEC